MSENEKRKGESDKNGWRTEMERRGEVGRRQREERGMGVKETW